MDCGNSMILPRRRPYTLYVEMLLGHDIALKGSYFKPMVRDLLEGNEKMLGYVAAVDALTINEENRLKKQVVELRGELQQAASKDVVFELAKKNNEPQETILMLVQGQKEFAELMKYKDRLEAIIGKEAI
jgi:hypothetical protein